MIYIKRSDQSNTLYCEFYEDLTHDGEMENMLNYYYELYDLSDDPYQLNNIYDAQGTMGATFILIKP